LVKAETNLDKDASLRASSVEKLAEGMTALPIFKASLIKPVMSLGKVVAKVTKSGTTSTVFIQSLIKSPDGVSRFKTPLDALVTGLDKALSSPIEDASSVIKPGLPLIEAETTLTAPASYLQGNAC
jgi:hypothetical protein